jgi:uncharacterized protein involved in response to NO
VSNQPSILLAAPHRLLFLVGSASLGLTVSWWLIQLTSLHFGGPQLPHGDLPAGLLHGTVMLYLVFPPFMLGFLLTVFPRWMGQSDLDHRQFGPVAIPQSAGALMAHVGLWLGIDPLFLAGFAVVALGWAFAIIVLGGIANNHRRSGKSSNWHSVSALVALFCGLVSLMMSIWSLNVSDSWLWRLSNQIALCVFLLPLFLTIAHRMVPFFAGNVVQDYVRWRPDWLLAALWLFLGARLAGAWSERLIFAVLADCGLLVLTAAMCWKWWPRSAAPGLLKVLVWGFAWAPVSFGLSAFSAAGYELGHAPLHAFTIGFAGSLLIAMVTRVTQGHSGQQLAMTGPAWLAFGAIQLAAVLRLGASLQFENGATLIGAAFVLVCGLLPWLLRNAVTYARKRSDGRPG